MNHPPRPAREPSAIPAGFPSRLYHGSTGTVRQIDLSLGAVKKDFGKGFYTTTAPSQAEMFARLKARRSNLLRGTVNVFDYLHSPSLVIKQFSSPSVDWLEFVLQNRGFDSPSAAQPFPQADIIFGPVANDAVGLVINQLQAGTYGPPDTIAAKETAIRLLEPERLYNQVFFATTRAIAALTFVQSYEVDR